MTEKDIDALFVEDKDNGIECGFNLRTLWKYHQSMGINTAVSPGYSRVDDTHGEHCLIRYAICPYCSNGYYLLKDAVECVNGHKMVDMEENKKHRHNQLNKLKSETVFQYGYTMLLHRNYAVISRSRILAENFSAYCGGNCIIIKREQDLYRIITDDGIHPDWKVIFLGRPSNYMGHFALENPYIYAELERIEAVRDAAYMVKQGDTLVPCDEWDIEDHKGEIFIRSLQNGQPVYTKVQKSKRSPAKSASPA